MKNGIRFAALSILFFSFTLVVSADIIIDPDSTSEPQPFTFYCQPYTEPFLSGGEYVPNNGGTCFFTVPQLFSNKAVLLYKGVEGNATFIQGDFTTNEPRSSLRLPSNFFGNAVQGENFFAVSFSSDNFGEIISGETYMRTGAGVRLADTTVLSWKWGAPPSGGSETSPLTVSADNKNMIYGNAIPTLSATLSGFIGDDTPASNDVTGVAECTTSATDTSPVGDYPITCTVGTLASAENYTFDTFLAGTLTIEQAPSFTTVDCPANVTYDGFEQTPCTASVSGSGGLSQSIEVNYTNNTNAGTAQASAEFSGDINHTGSNANKNFGIHYRWDGFLQPINDTAHQISQDVSVFKAGSTVPVKLQIKDVNGNLVTTAAPIWLMPQKGTTMSAPVTESVYTEPTTSGSSFQLAGDHYKYNWGTKGLEAGRWYKIYVMLPDYTIRSVVIGLR